MSKAIELADQAWRLRANAFRHKLAGDEAKQTASECVRLLEEAVAQATADDDDYGLAYALNKLAHLRGDFEGRAAAIALYRKAADAAHRVNSGLLEGEALRHWADQLRHDAKLEEAEGLYWKAMDALRSDPTTSTLSLANAYRPIAILNAEKGDRANSIRYWREARRLYAEVGIEAGVEECDNDLADLAAS